MKKIFIYLMLFACSISFSQINDAPNKSKYRVIRNVINQTKDSVNQIQTGNINNINSNNSNVFLSKDVASLLNGITFSDTLLGTNNIGIGRYSQYNNKYAKRTISIGSYSSYYKLMGNYNIHIGSFVSQFDVYGVRNTIGGYKATQFGRYYSETSVWGYKAFQNLDAGGDEITSYDSVDVGVVRVYSDSLPSQDESITIIGTYSPLDHEYRDKYDTIYNVDSVGDGYFVINSDFYPENTLLTLGMWVYTDKAILNSGIGYFSGNNVIRGSRNLCLGANTPVDDPNGDDQINIANTIKGSSGDNKYIDIQGALMQTPLSADPADPSDGKSVMWVSDGTGSGDAGDVMIKINVSDNVKTITLIDYSSY